jgi:hypothetical protein
MPDGSFYIVDAEDLQNAIDSVGRATPNAGESDVARRNAVRRHIIQRANELKLSSKIPDNWNSDGSLKTPAASHLDFVSEGEAFLAHFGRKGMKWGEHVFGRNRSTGSHPVHADVARARAAQAIIKQHGLSALGNNELRDLNKRTQLELDYHRLTDPQKSEAQKFIENTVREQGKQALIKYGPQGAAWLVKQGIKVYTGGGRHT